MPSTALRSSSSLHDSGSLDVARGNYREIRHCRICGNRNLSTVLSLGEQYLTGVFPRAHETLPTRGPLELVACSTADNIAGCGLIQLRQSYNLDEMYGENYGYRSSLNQAMVKHLRLKVEQLIQRYPLRAGDLVLDIGSNDGTLLSFYPSKDIKVVGIDPTARKFRPFYQDHIEVIPEFFSGRLFREQFGPKGARIVTSIAMFYDLEDPLRFMQDVASILEEDGIWHFEMSYLPSMVRTMGYDTICHEHLEYYSLHQIVWMAARSGLKVLDVEFNDTNGGSFAVTMARQTSSHQVDSTRLSQLLASEEAEGLGTATAQQAFAKAVTDHKTQLTNLLRSLKDQNRKVIGYGASTKGNVLLQHCGITPDLLPAIAEVNEEKFGCVTPGTKIPIISELDAHVMLPDYLLVLPWHFRDNILAREGAFLGRGGKMIFPLPTIEIVGA